MNENFSARAGMSVEETTDLFVPSQVGVGILEHERGEQDALLGLHLVGNNVGLVEDASVMVVLDVERAVGLIVQLRALLLEAGVSGGRIIAMMKEAYGRLDDVLSRDRAPVEES